jgi:hypothetical protein
MTYNFGQVEGFIEWSRVEQPQFALPKFSPDGLTARRPRNLDKGTNYTFLRRSGGMEPNT